MSCGTLPSWGIRKRAQRADTKVSCFNRAFFKVNLNLPLQRRFRVPSTQHLCLVALRQQRRASTLRSEAVSSHAYLCVDPCLGLLR